MPFKHFKGLSWQATDLNPPNYYGHLCPHDVDPDRAGQSSSTGRTPVNTPIPIRASITEYTSGELQALLRWVKSDGKLGPMTSSPMKCLRLCRSLEEDQRLKRH